MYMGGMCIWEGWVYGRGVWNFIPSWLCCRTVTSQTTYRPDSTGVWRSSLEPSMDPLLIYGVWPAWYGMETVLMSVACIVWNGDCTDECGLHGMEWRLLGGFFVVWGCCFHTSIDAVLVYSTYCFHGYRLLHLLFPWLPSAHLVDI